MVVWVCRTTWALLLRVLVVYRRRSLGWIASSKTCSFCCSHLYSIIAALFCGVSVVYLLRCRTYSLCSARALYVVEHNNLHTVVFFFLLFFPFSFSPQQTLLEQLQRGRGHYYFFYYLSAHSFFLSAMVVSHVKILSPQSRRPLTDGGVWWRWWWWWWTHDRQRDGKALTRTYSARSSTLGPEKHKRKTKTLVTYLPPALLVTFPLICLFIFCWLLKNCIVYVLPHLLHIHLQRAVGIRIVGRVSHRFRSVGFFV